MDWQPQENDLSQLIMLLFNTQSSDNAVQKENNKKLNELQNVPDFINYLIFVLTKMSEQPPEIRAVAGLLLKNSVAQDFKKYSPNDLIYLKSQALSSLGDRDPLVRHTLGTVISSLVILGGIENWPQALSQLFLALDSQDFDIVEGAWDTLRKICEDERTDLEVTLDNGQRPLDLMIPKFLPFFSSDRPILRIHSISTMSSFVQMKSEAIQQYLDVYIAELFKRAHDNDIDVRKCVCKAIVGLLEVRPDKLIPEIDNVVDYMIFSTQSDDLDLAMESCEFWLSFCDLTELVQHLKPHLPRLIPVLIERMVYSEDDLINLNVEENDSLVPDDSQDIKPRHHKTRFQGNSNDNSNRPSQAQDSDDDESDFDDDDDDDDVYSEWNLRKCAAASLDVLSTVFGNDILPITLPVLNSALHSDDWVKLESGILALGAIAEGCASGVESHLPTLIPYLINGCSNKHYLIRSISCWTCSRYSSWVVRPENKQYFEPLLAALLKAMLDQNKKVQEAACSAFATLEEDAGSLMIPYIESVLQTIIYAFSKYQHKNLIILYDSIGTLAEAVGSELAAPKYVEVLMPHMMARLSAIATNFNTGVDDYDTFSFLECLSSIAIAYGPSFRPYASPVFYHCISMIQETLRQYQMELSGSDEQDYDKDLINVSLDLISAIIQALGPSSSELICEDSDTPLLHLVGVCMTDSSSDVRQSAFALLGDLSQNCWELIEKHIPFYMQHLVPQIDPHATYANVTNNAIWAAGEIALRSKPQNIEPFINPLIERTLAILNNPESPISLQENSAIALGRFGFCSPQVLAPIVESFVERWCSVLKNITDINEKNSALQGMLNVVSSFGPEAKAELERRII
ncbi:Transportin-1 [Smittium mucronatum]|uniref:Transportin-1 n=1 Tax=Smittium mucronatum TaxID=133383 RepID=A0A1R0GZU3_9FUNG|nr:Transportin-1 [Smittium mucronatum]